VPTALAGTALRAANPLAASTARIALRISNLLIALPRVVGSICFDTSRTGVISSSDSTLQYRREANVNFLRQVPSQSFEKRLQDNINLRSHWGRFVGAVAVRLQQFGRTMLFTCHGLGGCQKERELKE
jgi:hypothetical protein